MADAKKHRVEIEFCLVCKFQGRALWIARELIDQRPDLADEFVLVPSSNGAFTVRYDGEVVFDYREAGPLSRAEGSARGGARRQWPSAHAEAPLMATIAEALRCAEAHARVHRRAAMCTTIC